MENKLKRGNKEFYDVQYQFEKNIKEIIYGHSLDRAGPGEDNFYNDGYVDKLFLSYMMGFSFAKIYLEE